MKSLTPFVQISRQTSSTPCDVALFAPFPFLPATVAAVGTSGVDVGAEFAYYEGKGAFTGMVSPSMVSSVGCKWALAGHSERRTLFGESDEVINKQVQALLEGSLGVVLCIGETQEEYEKVRVCFVISHSSLQCPVSGFHISRIFNVGNTTASCRASSCLSVPCS